MPNFRVHWLKKNYITAGGGDADIISYAPLSIFQKLWLVDSRQISGKEVTLDGRFVAEVCDPGSAETPRS